MSKFEIPLNGSNIVNPDRKQAFQDALNDDHKVQCADDQQITIAESDYQPAPRDHQQSRPAPNPVQIHSGSTLDLDQVVDHAYAHQVRTMEVHQEFLEHQREQIDLIEKILAKQGEVLENGSHAEASALLNTFQRTLDNFQGIREQSLQVHQTFLNQQSDFSDRILDVIDGRQNTVQAPRAAEPETRSPEPSWVVHNPHIVLEDEMEKQAPQEKKMETPPAPKAPAAEPEVAIEELAETLLRIVSENTGYPAEMLDLTMDLEADLGIDSIKRVEILAGMEETYPSLPAPDPEVLAETRTLEQIISVMNASGNGKAKPVQEKVIVSESLPGKPQEPEQSQKTGQVKPPAKTSSPASRDLLPILLEIVAENTGYPVEMLESDMDMEADLGIDSIKRVEILAEMEERVPGLPTPDAAVLAEMRTIGEIAALMDNAEPSPVEQTSAGEVEKKKATTPELKVESVELKYLPQPDHLEITPGKNNLIIISSDGTELTPALSAALSKAGWKVVIWDYPEHLTAENSSEEHGADNRVRQEVAGKESIREKFEEIKTTYGTPMGFIHLHPESERISDEIDQELIEQVFFIAASIKEFQVELNGSERPFFFTVTRNDGFLGLKSRDSLPSGSGLTGLIKSIRWEWPDVFCRAVDLQKELPVEHACSHLLEEIHDPDSGATDIGVNENGRVTIVAGK